MSDFNLRALVHEVADNSTIADPELLAKEVASRIGKNHVRAALEQALPTLVRAMMTRTPLISPGGHGPDDTHMRTAAGGSVPNRSRKVQEIRSAWAAQLRERICVGPKSYKFFGDCTFDDLTAAASVREAHAQQNAQAAFRLHTVADLLRRNGVAMVRELPDSILSDALGDAA
jgi:hypothetical protein